MNRKIAFSVDDDTHRIVMKIQDSRTNETLREIRPGSSYSFSSTCTILSACSWTNRGSGFRDRR